MSSYVTRTTRTVRTTGGPGGTTTETHTYNSDGKIIYFFVILKLMI